jgi:Haem-NO-binding
MYGLINDSVRRLVLEEAGEGSWDRIVNRAGIGQRTFAALHYYDDDLTYALLAAASDEFQSSPAILLRRFGQYWSTRIAPENYGGYLDSTGRDLLQVLAGLDAMHARLQSLFPQLHPPSIDVEALEEQIITLHCRSERIGLAPFVLGLLEGLADYCEVSATVTQIAARGEAADHDVFEIAL